MVYPSEAQLKKKRIESRKAYFGKDLKRYLLESEKELPLEDGEVFDEAAVEAKIEEFRIHLESGKAEAILGPYPEFLSGIYQNTLWDDIYELWVRLQCRRREIKRIDPYIKRYRGLTISPRKNRTMTPGYTVCYGSFSKLKLGVNLTLKSYTLFHTEDVESTEYVVSTQNDDVLEDQIFRIPESSFMRKEDSGEEMKKAEEFYVSIYPMMEDIIRSFFKEEREDITGGTGGHACIEHPRDY